MKSFSDTFFGNLFLPRGQCYVWLAEILWTQPWLSFILAFFVFTIGLMLWLVLHKFNSNIRSVRSQEDWQSALEKLQADNRELSAQNYFNEKIREKTPNLIYILDPLSFQTIYANKDTLQTLGYHPHQLIDMGPQVMQTLVHPEDLERRMEFLRNLITAHDEEVREIDFRIRHANGTYNWFQVKSTVFRRNEEGIPDQVLSITHDITSLKKTENSLRQTLLQLQVANEDLQAANEEINAASEELRAANEEISAASEQAQLLNETLSQHNHFIERITNTIPHLIYTFNLTTFKVDYFNKDLPILLGYPQEEASAFGTPAAVMKEILHPDDFEKRKNHYMGFVTAHNSEVRESEFRLMHADGQYRTFLFTNAVFSRNSEGIPNQLIGLAQDITPMKETELELRKANQALLVTQQQLQELSIDLEQRVKLRTAELAESNERFELAAQATNDAIWELYEGSPSIQWSASFEQIFGFLSQEEEQNPTLKAWFDRIHPDDREMIMVQQQQNLANQEKSWRMEYRFLRSNGQYAHVLTRALAIYHEKPSFYRLVGSLMDITPLKEAELSLQRRNEELQKINYDLDNFIYSASHDLKNPVTNLEGLMSVLSKQLVPAPISGNSQWVQMMENSIQRLKKTILDISEISKVQKGLEEAYETLDFSQIFNEIKEDITNLIAEATIRTDFQVGQMQYAHKNLRSILYNLLSNALKYRSPSRPAVVELATFMQADQLVLTVQDNGLGLTENQQNKLFTMFKRIHTQGEGSGIGLYMIKRMIENNGGKITVESNPDTGTCFSIYFKVPNIAGERAAQ
jgi:PAS domain S-box-containing protein